MALAFFFFIFFVYFWFSSPSALLKLQWQCPCPLPRVCLLSLIENFWSGPVRSGALQPQTLQPTDRTVGVSGSEGAGELWEEQTSSRRRQTRLGLILWGRFGVRILLEVLLYIYTRYMWE